MFPVTVTTIKKSRINKLNKYALTSALNMSCGNNSSLKEICNVKTIKNLSHSDRYPPHSHVSFCSRRKNIG